MKKSEWFLFFCFGFCVGMIVTMLFSMVQFDKFRNKIYSNSTLIGAGKWVGDEFIWLDDRFRFVFTHNK